MGDDRRPLPPPRDYRDDVLSLEAEYGSLQVSEAQRLKSVKEENRQLKRLIADQALNLQGAKDLLGKKC